MTSPALWMPGVERYDTGRRLTMRGPRGLCILTWHTFEAPYTYSPIRASRSVGGLACLHRLRSSRQAGHPSERR